MYRRETNFTLRKVTKSGSSVSKTYELSKSITMILSPGGILVQGHTSNIRENERPFPCRLCLGALGLAIADRDGFALHRSEGFENRLFVVELFVPAFLLPLKYDPRGEEPFWTPRLEDGTESHEKEVKYPGENAIECSGDNFEMDNVAMMVAN